MNMSLSLLHTTTLLKETATDELNRITDIFLEALEEFKENNNLLE
jgi:hypothetical protein